MLLELKGTDYLLVKKVITELITIMKEVINKTKTQVGEKKNKHKNDPQSSLEMEEDITYQKR
jgi:hypothetical protein